MNGAPAVARDAAASLIDRRRAGMYHVLTVHAPDVVAQAQPGQFVSIGVDAPQTLLRRPYAIAGVDRDRGSFDVVVAVVGRGSAWLVRRPVAERLDVAGPLGRGFSLSAAPARCVLVGGGYGTAALEWLGRCLRSGGHEVALLSGAATASRLYPLPPDGPFIETTEDGSQGRAGLVTDALTEHLERVPGAAVFACGPMAMLAVVARIARRYGCDCQVAVEEHMGCSVGVCMTCVVPTDQGYVRACIEGPVLDARRVDWDRVRASGSEPAGGEPGGVRDGLR